MNRHPLYEAAVQADAELHRLLAAAYGERRAGDMRYRPAHPGHPAIERAGARTRAASRRWLEEMQRHQPREQE